MGLVLIMEGKMTKILGMLSRHEMQLSNVDSSVIELFEERESISIPPELKEIFQFVAGENGIEINHVFLYGLDRFKPVRSYINDFQVDDSDSYYAIGDFDDWCWGYAVDVRQVGFDCPVFLVGRDDPLIEISSSSFEFIEYCISNDRRLIG